MFRATLLKIALCAVFFGVYFTSKAAFDDFSIGASYDNAANVITITWPNNDACVEFFVLQSSDNEEDWSNLDTLYNSSVFDKQIIWEYRSPAPGGSSYRIMAVIDEHNANYSVPVFVKGQPSLYEWGVGEAISRDTLVLQYLGSGKIKGVINVSLQNARGTVLYKTRLGSMARTIEIPTSNLGKGKYDISITVGGEVIWRQRLKKQPLGADLICRLY